MCIETSLLKSALWGWLCPRLKEPNERGIDISPNYSFKRSILPFAFINRFVKLSHQDIYQRHGVITGVWYIQHLQCCSTTALHSRPTTLTVNNDLTAISIIGSETASHFFLLLPQSFGEYIMRINLSPRRCNFEKGKLKCYAESCGVPS